LGTLNGAIRLQDDRYQFMKTVFIFCLLGGGNR